MNLSAFNCPTLQDGCPVETGVCGNVDNVTWPETEIGQVASVPCPCGVSDPLIQELRGTRRCGGTYDTGAVWEEPQCDSCRFSSTRRTLCQLAEVGLEKRLTFYMPNINDDQSICSQNLSTLAYAIMSSTPAYVTTSG